MNQSMSDAPPRRPTLGLVAQIAGVVGAILCVLAIVIVITGRTWVQERVDVLQAGAAQTLEQALAVGDQALEGLASGAQEVSQIRTAAEGLAANPALDEVAITALQQRLAPLAERYGDARQRYAALREKAGVFLDTLGRLERIVPGLDLPDGPVDLVSQIDQGLTALDETITDLSAKAADRSGATEVANAIAGAAGRLETSLASATTLATEIRTDLADMRDSVQDVTHRAETWVTYGAIAVALFLAWVLVLHLALVALGRRWRAA